jgi:hypothetical protein
LENPPYVPVFRGGSAEHLKAPEIPESVRIKASPGLARIPVNRHQTLTLARDKRA